jgi:DNA-binding response OmpR family regulator
VAGTVVERGYQFGPFHLDARERRLSRGGTVILLRLKVFETLLVLVENAGRLVTNGGARSRSASWHIARRFHRDRLRGEASRTSDMITSSRRRGAGSSRQRFQVPDTSRFRARTI